MAAWALEPHGDAGVGAGARHGSGLHHDHESAVAPACSWEAAADQQSCRERERTVFFMPAQEIELSLNFC
jgi:hypothetical protein